MDISVRKKIASPFQKCTPVHLPFRAPSSSAQTYRYTPLKYDHDIRLLHLNPGSDEDAYLKLLNTKLSRTLGGGPDILSFNPMFTNREPCDYGEPQWRFTSLQVPQIVDICFSSTPSASTSKIRTNAIDKYD